MIKAENRYLLKTKPVKEAIDIAVGKYGEASLNKICPIEMPRTHTKMIAMLKSVILCRLVVNLCANLTQHAEQFHHQQVKLRI